MVNRGLETYLRCFTSDKPFDWTNWIAWEEYHYNASYHMAAGMTPFRTLYGRQAPPLVHYEKGSATSEEVEA